MNCIVVERVEAKARNQIVRPVLACFWPLTITMNCRLSWLKNAYSPRSPGIMTTRYLAVTGGVISIGKCGSTHYNMVIITCLLIYSRPFFPEESLTSKVDQTDPIFSTVHDQ